MGKITVWLYADKDAVDRKIDATGETCWWLSYSQQAEALTVEHQTPSA